MNEEYRYLMKKAETEEEAFARLSGIMEVLRENCPWDREQTYESLRPCMIEEAYEVAEAIDSGDKDNLKEELGDVMLQVMFHTLLAQEEGVFTRTDVINEECEKMIRRHPHIFTDIDIKTVDKVLEKWENITQKEHREGSHTDRLKDVPKALPALIRAGKVQNRAARVGFDWEDARGAFEKIAEETEELKTAFRNDNYEEMCEELGDLLFAVVNTARFLDVEPENALERATEKFISRFASMEEMAGEEGKDLDGMTLAQLDDLWEKAKTK